MSFTAREMMRAMAAETALEPLGAPVYFVMRDPTRIAAFRELFETSGMPPSASVYWNKWDGETAWIINTYIQLRRRGIDARLTDRFVPQGLCVATYDDLRRGGMPWRSYVIACRMDRARPTLCEEVIVQNRTRCERPTDHYIAHWPQLSLRPRDDERGARLENMVFHGEMDNIDQEFRGERFRDALRELGISFVVHGLKSNRVGVSGRDWSQTDAVLAVRGGTEYFRSVKPALKLVNAWQAGCPALLGPEAGYREERRSELDYFEVATAEQALGALRRLKDEPGLFRAISENGRRRAMEHTPDVIANRWCQVLARVIENGYSKWMKRSAASQFCAGAVRHFGRTVMHKIEREKFWKALGGRSYKSAATVRSSS
ncbi:MAG: glycosyltransferase family 1 protein [Phycisphaeraceae bacterium]|nr:glycosyltransferase family 1 protein [Phycisphaeraceae bacterium]